MKWGSIFFSIPEQLVRQVIDVCLTNTVCFEAGFDLFVVFITARFSIWFGPVATVFLLPSEIFPTAIRTSCVGISAAFGKVGAILGVFLIPVFEPAIGISAVFVICAGVALLAIAVTHVCIPEDTLASGADEADKLGEAPVSGPTPAAEAPAAEAPAPSEDTGLLEDSTR